MSTESLAVLDAPPEDVRVARLPRLDVGAIQQRVADIERIIESLMVKGVHYGPPFPGSDQDSLLQAGAELLFEGFNLAPDPKIDEENLGDGHKRMICSGAARLPDGRPVGSMSAECSTHEPKYRYRKSERVCPACGSATILRSKHPDKQTGDKGWFCWAKKGGCGATYAPDDEAITGQEAGRVEHPDPAELWHTCRMMAQKRWLVALARRTFALSARFVDAEAAQAARFNWKRAAPLLRAMPGEKREKWDRVIVHCLGEFGRPPEEITNLEGAVVLEWLAGQVAESGRLRADDFMESPEEDQPAPPAKQAEPSPEVEKPESAAAEGPTMSASTSAELAKELKRAGGSGAVDAFCEALGRKVPDWLEADRDAVLEAIREAKAAKP